MKAGMVLYLSARENAKQNNSESDEVSSEKRWKSNLLKEFEKSAWQTEDDLLE